MVLLVAMNIAAVLLGGKNVLKLIAHYFKKIIQIYASIKFLCKTQIFF